MSSFGPPKWERHGQIRGSLVEGPKGDGAGVLAPCGELILFSLDEGCFWGHLTAPPVPTRGHQGDGARLLAVVHGRRATMGTS